MKTAFVIIFCALMSFSRAQTAIGMDIGQPINPVTGAINLGVDTTVVGASCTPWVRINFILGPWSSPADQTLYNGLTWKQTYDKIIDALVAKGIQVYGLIGHEAYTYPADTLEQYPGNAANADAWINGYVYNFVQIVGFFKDRVQVFESFNEPNNWTNSSTAIVHEAWYAKLLQQVYLETKCFNGHDVDPTWQVTLVSGALFTFDLNTGGQYINDTYWYGKNVWAWDWTHATYGAYPLDGFGQHIYVEQGSSNPTTVASAIQNNVNDFWNNIYVYEDDPNKKIYISEFGWESATYGESFQAQNLNTGFATLTADSRIALALWFTQMDFPGTSWGLYNMGNYAVSDQKQSFTAFQSLNNCSFTTGVSGYPATNDLYRDPRGHYYLRPADGNFSFCLSDLSGKILVEGAPDASRKDAMRLDLDHLPAGLYLLSVRSATGLRTYKLIK